MSCATDLDRQAIRRYLTSNPGSLAADVARQLLLPVLLVTNVLLASEGLTVERRNKRMQWWVIPGHEEGVPFGVRAKVVR